MASKLEVHPITEDSSFVDDGLKVRQEILKSIRIPKEFLIPEVVSAVSVARHWFLQRLYGHTE